MPNPELSQYHDHDTDTVYDYKDATARGDITELYKYQYKVLSVYVMNGGGFSSDRRRFIFDISTVISETYFRSDYDGGVIRCIFTPWPDALTYDPDAEINFDIRPFSQNPLIVPVYTNAKRDTVIKWGEVNNFVMDFVFRKTETSGYFIALSAVASVNAANVAYNNGTSGLTAGNVQDAIDEVNAEKIGDNPTFSEAATRQNIASGETFAVILGKIKKFFSDLKAVAFSGSYNDLTDKPTIPAAQVQADWNEADNTAADYIKNKPTIPDISTKMDKSNPTGSGNFSINRQLGSTVGAGSSTIGYDCIASGMAAVAGGYQAQATGDFAQANNYMTEANGKASTTNGWQTIANSDYQQVGGKYNVADNAYTYAEIIGNGTADNNRSNARTLDWNGNETIAGDFYFNGNNAALSSQLSDKADASALATVATSGDYDDLLNKPTIPAAQVQSDWAEANSAALDYIKNKPSLATVATSGNYSDLNGKPTLPGDYKHNTNSQTINNSTLTQITSISLTKGYWLVFGSVSFANNANGRRAASLFFSDQSTTIDEFNVTQPPISGGATHMQVHGIYYASGNVTAYVQAWQNSGSNLTGCGGRIAAVFISA